MDINASLVRELIAAQFPAWAELLIHPIPLDGHDNRTFRLGSEMSVRLPSAERYAAQVEKEQRWLPRLAPLLPLLVPVPLAMGAPSPRYPWRWSVYKWLEGESASTARIPDPRTLATTLAAFLGALHRADATGRPQPGHHNFFRGGPLTVYDPETRSAIAALSGEIDRAAATEVWETAVHSTWRGPPVWVHGDVSASNLLVCEGLLRGVIDFGCSGVGDPACDLTIAWTFFAGESRRAFRRALVLDDATWARARGWALWKGLITLAANRESHLESTNARRVIAAVIGDHLHVP